MKFTFYFVILIKIISGFAPKEESTVEFVCWKKNKASSVCYFNFKVDGVKYRFTDHGCEFEKKQDEIIEKARRGDLALAKDWTIECPEATPAEEPSYDTGF